MNKLLIVEDDKGLQSQYKWGLGDEFELFFASTKEEAVTIADAEKPPVILLDLGLPPDPDNASEGLAFLSEAKVKLPSTKIVVLTGSELKEHALKAVELGAWDFQQKGLELDELKTILHRAINMQSLEQEVLDTKLASFGTSNLIGTSAAMNNVIRTLTRVAPMQVSTLIWGESGTGKELFAQNIHEMSKRTGEFVAINCASIPPELLESELFGHEKGAFTGAHKMKTGEIERANGGTLFLDEIGDMPIDLQSKMLRFLQEREIKRVGGGKSIKVDVRVVCATHRDLEHMSNEGTFRLDLFYRLAEVTLTVPALRERDGDIILLAEYLLNTYRTDFNPNVKGYSNDALTALMHHNFPGNIRELQNRIKSAIIMCDGELISAKDLKLELNDNMLCVPESWLLKEEYTTTRETLEDIRKKAESKALFNAYREANFNISEAAKLLDITRPTFYALTNKHGMRMSKED